MIESLILLPQLVREADLRKYMPGEIYPLKIQEIIINPHQVSKHCDQQLVDALAAWIMENKRYPVLMFTIHDDQPTLVAGEYTLRATESLDYDTVPGRYITGSLRALAYLETTFREDMSRIQENSKFNAFSDEIKNLFYKHLSRMLHMELSDIDHMYQAGMLPDSVKARFRAKEPEEIAPA